MDAPTSCRCAELPDLAVIPIGGDDELERIVATFGDRRRHGGELWWLSAATCRACGQGWQVAQDDRIHDNVFLDRLTAEEFADIAERDEWPALFLRYATVLGLGVEFGHYCRFDDPFDPSLIDAVQDLKRENPAISTSDIAYLLALSPGAAATLAEH